MALKFFTDAVKGHTVAVNPAHVVLVFSPNPEEGKEEPPATIISTLNGNIPVTDDFLIVTSRLNEIG
jgi:hypothetical protein